MTAYVVKVEDIHFSTVVYYNRDEEHSEEIAIDYVLGNYMKELREAIRKNIYVDDIKEEVW